MKTILSLLSIMLLSIGADQEKKDVIINNEHIQESSAPSKIQVLNFATFHMGTTVDDNKVDFDEKNEKNQKEAHKIAQMISEFKPTIICVEATLDEQEILNTEYQKYLNTSDKSSLYTGEIGLVAFEVGKIANVEKLYGIDCEMKYNYNIANEIENAIDPTTLTDFYTNLLAFYPEFNVDESKLSTLDRLKIGNSSNFLDFLILTNADLLTHVGTEDGYEGADEAAKFYQRNLRIYSNLNRINATKEDRIFIITGGAHAAFLKEFMKRSPKYEMVNTLDYLN